jgi:hypothetical protein
MNPFLLPLRQKSTVEVVDGDPAADDSPLQPAQIPSPDANSFCEIEYSSQIKKM